MPPRERPSRRLEPVEEAPRRRRPAPAPARRRAAPRTGARHAARASGCGSALLLVLALIAGGIAAYQAASGSVQQGVQLKRDVQGKVNDAVDEVKGLIDDNTR